MCEDEELSVWRVEVMFEKLGLWRRRKKTDDSGLLHSVGQLVEQIAYRVTGLLKRI